ncbi:unnamed protein product [Closterium sp. Naga37s-1]|nr:unnamed protein product [Closterium sp. Naga37s-1]
MARLAAHIPLPVRPFSSVHPSPFVSGLASPFGTGDMPSDVPWRKVKTKDQRTLQQAFSDFVPRTFEIFIAAAYSRILDGKNVRVYPYTLGYALYGAEYPIMHYSTGKTDLSTKDSPNMHNAARMCAIVRNWLRAAIMQWAGQDGGPVWVAEEEAWRFSPGKHFNVFIKFPPLEAVRGLPEEIVGDEKEDKDFADASASHDGAGDEDDEP